MPVSVVSTSTANNGLTGTPATVTVAAPTAIASGNLLIAFTTSDGASTFSAPSGWTLYELIPAVSNSPSFTIFWKIATGSEPSTYSFVASPVEALIVSILNISGASIVSPFNGYFTKYPSASLATAGSTLFTTRQRRRSRMRRSASGLSVGLKTLQRPRRPTGIAIYSKSVSQAMQLLVPLYVGYRVRIGVSSL